jgi:acetyltransferase-like isoleucine patch superfamily enzyme
MRIGRLFSIWNRAWFPIWRAYARLWRAQVDPSVEFLGAPLVRGARGSTLRIRAGVRITSSTGGNPVIGARKARICTIAPGALLDIGANVGMSAPCLCAALEITIGEGTILGADALITDTDFHLPAPSWGWRNENAGTAKPVRIGRGCFVGARAIILKGVTIGDGAVIGAGAVVCRDVPPGHLAIGNPAVVKPLGPRWLRDEHGNPLEERAAAQLF